MNLIWNKSEKRFRLPGRLLLGGAAISAFALMVTLAAGILASIVLAAQGGVSQAESAARWESLLLGQSLGILAFLSTAFLFGTLAALRLIARRIDHRTAADYGLGLDRAWWKDLGFGLALGAGLVTLIFLVELAFGWVTPVGFLVAQMPGQSFGLALVGPAVLFLTVGIYEEVLSRGWLYRNLLDGLGFLGPRGAKFAVVGITSLVFGLLHGANPNTTWVSMLNLVLMGVFLALGMALTGRLGISIGLHIAWNFFMGNVFGFPVSGTATNATTFIQVIQSGPTWLTGGAFGPEAGLLGLAAAALGSFCIFLWVSAQRSDPAQPGNRSAA